MFALTLLVAIAGVLAGCAKQDSQQQTSNPGASQQSAKSVTETNVKPVGSEFSLVGVWLGTSGMDREALNQRLETLDPESQQRLLATAATFDSMFVAAQYNEDQSLELDMTITPQGSDTLRDQAYGSWEASKESDQSLLVRTVEYHGDQKEESTKRYVIVDENHFVITPNVSDDLKEFQPVVLFERVAESEIPMTAAGESATELK
jgi:hypothetical protein